MRLVKTKSVAWIVAAALTLLGIACGGSPGPDAEEATAERTGGETMEAAGALPEACGLVTQADASDLFGHSAVADDGPSAPTMIDQCLWTWDTETSNQLLQFHIWKDFPLDQPADAQTLGLGDGGYIRVHPMAGVDITWRQGGRVFSIAYSTIGPDAPKAPEREEQVRSLAERVSKTL